MKAVCESVLMFTLVCLLGCCLCIGAQLQGETAACCPVSSSNGTMLKWERCKETCRPGYYADGRSNDTGACPSGSSGGNGTDGTTTTTTASVTSQQTTNTSYRLCKPCAHGCKNCSGGSINDCSECHGSHENRTVNGTVTCAKRAEPDDNLLIIIGASVGSVVVIVSVVLVIIFCCRRYRRRHQKSQFDEERVVRSEVFPSEDDDDGQSVTSTEAVDAGRKVSSRKGLEEPNYENMPKHAVRPFSIEKGHDNVLRYTRDPTMKKEKPELRRSPSEESDLEHLPPAPKPPSKQNKNPPRDVYEIVETEADNREMSKRHQGPVVAAPQDVYVDVDNTKPKPNPKPKPKPSPKPGKTHAEPEPSPQPRYEFIDLPKSTRNKAERSKTTKPSGTHVHKGPRRKTGGPSPNTESYPNPASPVSCPAELPKFPIEQANAKKKPLTPLKPKAKTLPKSPPAVNVDDESDPEEGYENAPKKKEKEPHHKNGQTIPNTDDDDSDPEADYENAPKDKGPFAAMGPGKTQPHGTDNPAVDMELEDPEQVYGNQDVIEDVVKKSGTGPRNTGRVVEGRAAEADSDPGDDYEEMADPLAASSSPLEEDDDQPIYGNDISDEESPEQPYQNVPFPKKS